MKIRHTLTATLAVLGCLGSAPAVEFFDGVTPVTQGVIDITNDKLLFSDVSQSAGSRAKNITPLMLRTELGLTPGTDVQAFSSKLAAFTALANGSGVLTNNGSGIFSWSASTGATNLTTVAAPTTLTVASDTGTDAVLPVPDGTNAGVMLAAEKIKLAGIATNATANSADATLLARANHTGTQSADTITDGAVNKAFTAAEKTKLAAQSGTNTGDQTTITGNAATATALQTSRLINGTPFDGTADISVGLGASFQAETQAWLARVTTASGVVSLQTAQLVDTWIARCKAEGTWSPQFGGGTGWLWLPVGDFTASKIPIMRPAGILDPVFNNFVAADYSEGFGYVLATNTTKHVDTKYIPSAQGVSGSSLTFTVANATETDTSSGGYQIGSLSHVASAEPKLVYSQLNKRMGFVNAADGGIGVSSIRWSASTQNGAQNGVDTEVASPAVVTLSDEISLFRTIRQDNNTYYAVGSLSFVSVAPDIGSTALLKAWNSSVRDLMTVLRKPYQGPYLQAFGDSLTEDSGSSWPRKLSQQTGLRVVNSAKGGTGLTSSLHAWGIERYTGLIDGRPGMIAAIYGTNDINADANTNGGSTEIATYQAAWNTILAAWKAAGKTVVVGSLPVRTSANDTKLAAYTAATATPCKANRVRFCDLFRLTRDLGDNTFLTANYLPDGIHPNPALNILIGGWMAQAAKGVMMRIPTLDFPSVAAAGVQDLTVTVLNAVVGNPVGITPPTALDAGLVASAWVSANDTVTIRLTNVTGSSIDPAAGRWTVGVTSDY